MEIYQLCVHTVHACCFVTGNATLGSCAVRASERARAPRWHGPLLSSYALCFCVTGSTVGSHRHHKHVNDAL